MAPPHFRLQDRRRVRENEPTGKRAGGKCFGWCEVWGKNFLARLVTEKGFISFAAGESGRAGHSRSPRK
jgi:hypothetical protein